MSKHFTRQEIEEIRMQLAQKGKKDTDFEETDKFVGDDFFVIVQDGVNKKIRGHTFRSDYNEIAEQDHLRAMEDRQTANSDHNRAENDHSRALTDSGRASQDHSRAESDNSRALEDHSVAESDHRRAVEDHSTATNDHTRAEEDHVQAVTDSQQAVADHAVMAGYDTRLGNVEDEVSQLGQKVDELAQGKFYGYFSDADELPAGDVPGFAYVGTAAPFAIYNFDGSDWSDSGLTIDEIHIGNGEDIDTNEDGKLQFANRVYNAQQPNGMGYKILRKDATFASQVTDTNTIYEIRYEFDLDGEEVTIPANCILKFNGGTVDSGSLSLDSNVIVCGDGTFKKTRLIVRGTSGQKKTGILVKDVVFDCNDDRKQLSPIVFEYVNGVIIQGIDVKNFNHRYISDENEENYHVIFALNCENIQVRDSAFVGVYPEGLNFKHCNSVYVDNILVEDVADYPTWTSIHFWFCNGVSISNSIFKHTSSAGSTINICSKDFSMFNCQFYGGKGIDVGNEVEAFESENYVIENCIVENCVNFVYGSGSYMKLDGLTLRNCKISQCTSASLIETSVIKNINISGCVFSDCPNASSILSMQNSDSSNTDKSENIVVSDNKFKLSVPSSFDFIKFGAAYNDLDSVSISRNDIDIYQASTFSFAFLKGTYANSPKCFISNNTVKLYCSCYLSNTKGFRCLFENNQLICLWTGLRYFYIENRDTEVSFIGNILYNMGILLNNVNTITSLLIKANTFFNGNGAIAIRLQGSLDHIHIVGNYSNGCVITEAGSTAVSLGSDFTYDDNILGITSNIATNAFKSKISSLKISTKTSGLIGYGDNSSRPQGIITGTIYFDTTLGKMIVSNGTAWVNMDGTPLLAKSGTTSARPSATSAGAGYTYFDTDLGKMIVSNGTTWVNMDGTALA